MSESLVVFDDTKHSVGLGPAGSTTAQGFMVQPGSYRKLPQERDTRRVEIGPNRWIQDFKVSQWAQEDFSGGAYQDLWSDQAMFYRCTGLLPGQSRTSLRTTPTLRHCLNATPHNCDVTTYPGLANFAGYVYAFDKLYVLGGDGVIYVFAYPATIVEGTSYDGDVEVFTKNVAIAGVTARCIGANRILGTIIVGYSNGRVHEYEEEDLDLYRTFTYDTTAHADIYPGHKDVRAITVYAGQVVVAMANRLMYWDAADDTQEASPFTAHSAAPAWVKLGDAAEENVVEMVQQGNLLCIMSQTGTASCSVDSSNLAGGVLPWIDIPFLFCGQSMASYAGRLYVGGAGYDADGTEQGAVLFEISGGVFREIRTYYGLDSQFGAVGRALSIPYMTVFEGMLFFANGATGSLEAYDFITDALYTCYSRDGTKTGTPRGLVGVGVSMFVLCTGATTNGGLYYAPKENVHNVASVLETSEFAVEPSMFKRWSTASVHTRYGGVTMTGTIDGGLSWVALTKTSQVVSGYNYTSTFDLSALGKSVGVRLRIDFGLSDDFTDPSVQSGISLYYWRELVSYAVGFMLAPPKLRLWTFAILAVECPGLLDGTIDNITSPEETIAQLWSWYEDDTLLTLHDRDGAVRPVMITQLQETEPAMRGKVSGAESVEREAYMTLTLAETTTV